MDCARRSVQMRSSHLQSPTFLSVMVVRITAEQIRPMLRITPGGAAITTACPAEDHGASAIEGWRSTTVARQRRYGGEVAEGGRP
jgi:hypothetical protein